MCSEDGAYVLNYAGCFQCKDTNRAHDALKSKSKSVITEEDDEEEKEITTFEREILLLELSLRFIFSKPF